MSEFEHCEHDLDCWNVAPINDVVRTPWRCVKCGASGYIDLPARRPPGVSPAFVNALAEAALRALQLRNESALRAIIANMEAKRERVERRESAGEPAPESIVYVIRNERSGHLKIGVSVNPAARLLSLQTGTVDKLRLLLTVPGVDEATIHNRFAGSRLNGEWFVPSVEILDWIEENLR